MWFFMLACYLLSGLSFLLFSLTGFSGYLPISLLPWSHPAQALFTIICYLFTETLIMFYFVGTGVSVKEFIMENNGDKSIYDKCTALKRRIYPPILLNILLVGTTFILGGAVHTRAIPGALHGLSFWIAALHYLWCIRIMHGCFKDNTRLMLQAFGVAPPEPENK